MSCCLSWLIRGFLSPAGAVAVAEFIAESPRLLRLDLRENEIKTGGLMALSLALKVNHSLLRLDLDREPKKESVSGPAQLRQAALPCLPPLHCSAPVGASQTRAQWWWAEVLPEVVVPGCLSRR